MMELFAAYFYPLNNKWKIIFFIIALKGVSAVAILGLTLGLTVGLKSYHEDSDEVLDKAPVIDG